MSMYSTALLTQRQDPQVTQTEQFDGQLLDGVVAEE